MTRRRTGPALPGAAPWLPAVLVAAAVSAAAAFQVAPARERGGRPWTRDQQEAFLTSAKVIRSRAVSKGISGTTRATLSDGVTTHDASIQTIDETRTEFRSGRGVEFNFRDSWHYNVAAYRLDRLLDLGMIPPSVPRHWRGEPGSFTWWVDDVLMDEGGRAKAQLSPPNPGVWGQQVQVVRVFDALIHNTDRNLGNLLIDRAWNVWMIDHTRAFRLQKTLLNPQHLLRCDRRLLERLRGLDREAVARAVDGHLTPYEIDALVARRDLIVAHFDRAAPSALFDLPPR